jgi:hypothetical protein
MMHGQKNIKLSSITSTNKHITQLFHIRVITMDGSTWEMPANVKLDLRKRNVKLRGLLLIMLYLE